MKWVFKLIFRRAVRSRTLKEYGVDCEGGKKRIKRMHGIIFYKNKCVASSILATFSRNVYSLLFFFFDFFEFVE